MKVMDVVVLDERLFCDLVLMGMDRLPQLGEEVFARSLAVSAGGVLNTAVALRRLDLKVGLAAHIGDDFFSRFIREQMAHEQLDEHLLHVHQGPLPAVTVAVPIDSERAFLSYVEPYDVQPFGEHYLDGVEARHLHIGSLQAALRDYRLVSRAKARGRTVSLDCQCTREALEEEQVRSVLALVDYLMPNKVEAQRMTGVRDAEAAARQLGAWVPNVVVKCGERGVIAWSAGRTFRLDGLALTPVDTTGAGDCFNAGFIFGLLSGCSFEECLHYGNITGGLSTLGSGASKSPTLKEFEQWLQAVGRS